MMSKISVSIVGASGYVGGELLRLLLQHPNVVIRQATSQRFTGQSVGRAHPNLRGHTPLEFDAPDMLEPVEQLFLCLPHGQSMQHIDTYRGLAAGIIDLSADFRLNDAAAYELWYGRPHARPDLLRLRDAGPMGSRGSLEMSGS